VKLKWTAGVTAAIMAASLLVTSPAAAAPPRPWQPPATQAEKSVPTKPFAPRTRRAAPILEKVPVAVSWPAAGEASVPLRGTRARAGKLPVWVAGKGAGSAKVRVLDRRAADKAGVPGLLFTVDAGAARSRLTVEVDYSSFRYAYGGDWASRLRLVELPACALSTPERVECRSGKPLPTRNRVKDGTLSAEVSSAAVLAAAAASSGSSGDYSATALARSATSPGRTRWTHHRRSAARNRTWT
jgi:hypothetical protein